VKANKKGCVLRYVAVYENGKANIGLKEIPAEHPFYSLKKGTNIVTFTTERYKKDPLVISGPGAGAEVTAAGVFSEIIQIAKSN